MQAFVSTTDPMRNVRLLACLASLAAVAIFFSIARASNPDALWQIVHNSCEPAARGADVPQKCIDVDASHGFAVLKDLNGIAQYLLIPTARVGGIESPDLLSPDSPNYWRAAWQARRFVEAKLGEELPRDGGHVVRRRQLDPANHVVVGVGHPRRAVGRDRARECRLELLRGWVDTKRSGTGTQAQDAIAMLMADHKKVKKLFSDYDKPRHAELAGLIGLDPYIWLAVVRRIEIIASKCWT